jgi:hypothetical protein
VFLGFSIALLGTFVLEKYLRTALDRASRFVGRVLRWGYFDL